MLKWERLLGESRAVATVWWAQHRLADLDSIFRAAAATSRTSSGFGTVRRFIRGSSLYRWLSTEPDSREIAIVLRNSYLLDPLLPVILSIHRTGPTAPTIRMADRIATTIETHPIPIASGAVLGFVIATAIRTWSGASPLWLLALFLAGFAGVLGLLTRNSQRALSESRVRALLVDVDSSQRELSD